MGSGLGPGARGIRVELPRLLLTPDHHVLHGRALRPDWVGGLPQIAARVLVDVVQEPPSEPAVGARTGQLSPLKNNALNDTSISRKEARDCLERFGRIARENRFSICVLEIQLAGSSIENGRARSSSRAAGCGPRCIEPARWLATTSGDHRRKNSFS